MIGYKTYNSLLKQWEFYSSDDSKRKTDFGSYVSPINLNLVYSSLQSRQSRYDENRKIAENYVIDLALNIYNSSESVSKGDYYSSLFIEEINETATFRNIDFSKTNQANVAIKVIKEVFIEFKEKYFN
ncbi:hypothetical protein VQ01_03955 [Tamlana sp. s12]|nr:hypothetical protein VQ01_03955 [Tamlana sp. s12]